MMLSCVFPDMYNKTKTSRYSFYKYLYFLPLDVVAGNPVNYRFPKGSVRADWVKKCNKWQGTLVGCEKSKFCYLRQQK